MNEVTFESIIGYESVKEELLRFCDALKNRECYAALGAESPRGLVLYGVPGVGKSMMAAALIHESGRKAFVCRKDEPNGEFVKKIKETFREARESAPSIVFLDDVDKFANEDNRHRDTEEYVTIQSCIDEVRGQEVFVLATANDISKIPRSLIRSGRFDRVLHIKPPAGEEAEQIVAHYLKGKSLVKDVDAGSLARLMAGRSCADLESVINSAAVYAGFERSEYISMEHMLRVVLRKWCGINSWKAGEDVTDPEEMKQRRIIAWHEAAHAVVQEVYDPGTVVLMGISEESLRGVTQKSETVRYRYDWGMECMINILNSFAGPAATEQKYGTHDVGAARDIDNAITKIRELVEEKAFAGLAFVGQGNMDCSENLSARIDIAVNVEAERLYRKAKEILAVNREAHERLADALYDRGILTAADVQEVLAGYELVRVGV